jgi:hypothetical protein
VYSAVSLTVIKLCGTVCMGKRGFGTQGAFAPMEKAEGASSCCQFHSWNCGSSKTMLGQPFVSLGRFPFGSLKTQYMNTGSSHPRPRYLAKVGSPVTVRARFPATASMSALFLKRFLRNPFQVASVVPSFAHADPAGFWEDGSYSTEGNC